MSFFFYSISFRINSNPDVHSLCRARSQPFDGIPSGGGQRAKDLAQPQEWYYSLAGILKNKSNFKMKYYICIY